MSNPIVRYFDLQSERRPAARKERAPADVRAGSQSAPTDHAHVLPQYGAVSLGVLVEPFLHSSTALQSLNFGFGSIVGRTVFALLIAIVLLPAVYKNAFDPDKPIFVQLCALFTSGVGWQSLFQAGAAAVQGPVATS